MHSNKKKHTALLNHMHNLANEHPIDNIPDLMTLQARVVVCHGTMATLVRQIQLALGNIPLSQGDMALCLTLLGRDMDQQACSAAVLFLAVAIWTNGGSFEAVIQTMLVSGTGFALSVARGQSLGESMSDEELDGAVKDNVATLG